MNGATLKTIREALGLPITWLAGVAGVQERTARYWESGRMAAPADVCAMLQDMERAAALVAAHGVTAVRDQVAAHGGQKPAGPVLLVRYADAEDLARYQPDMAGLPVTFHGAILARVRWALAEDGIDVEMRTLDAPAYEVWLKATRQKDSPALRSEFVALPDGA